MLKIKQLDKPLNGEVEEDINWICDSLGLCSGRDVDSTTNKIIIEILEQRANLNPVSTNKLSEDLELKQGIINHHLRALINSGLIIRENKQIFIRGGSLKEAVKEMRRDALRLFEDIEEMAEIVDKELGLKNR